MRSGARVLLFTVLGALAALLVVFFVGEEPPSIAGARELPRPTSSATAPAGVNTQSGRDGPAVEERATGIDPEGDVADGAGGVDTAVPNSAVAAGEPPIDTARGSTTANRARANALPPAPSGNGSDETAETPPFWCFLARNGFSWQEERTASGPQHLSSDTSVVWQGSTSARITSTDESDGNAAAGVMWQAILATPLRGKRVEVAAQIRARFRLIGAGHLFVRTQPQEPSILLLADPPGTGGLNHHVPSTGDWERYGVVLDVPSDAYFMYYGFALYGGGDVWIDDVRISIVGEDRALTHSGSIVGNPPIYTGVAWSAPQNLDFESSGDGPPGELEPTLPSCTRQPGN